MFALPTNQIISIYVAHFLMFIVITMLKTMGHVFIKHTYVIMYRDTIDVLFSVQLDFTKNKNSVTRHDYHCVYSFSFV